MRLDWLCHKCCQQLFKFRLSLLPLLTIAWLPCCKAFLWDKYCGTLTLEKCYRRPSQTCVKKVGLRSAS